MTVSTQAAIIWKIGSTLFIFVFLKTFKKPGTDKQIRVKHMGIDFLAGTGGTLLQTTSLLVATTCGRVLFFYYYYYYYY